jgi:DNA-binding IclR family transcriptional regulator
MVASALSANRALAVLDWIVGHPGEAFSLSELSRALDINIPSLMSVLQSLTDAGYLTRHATRKTYEAGPALLAIGLAVSAHHPTLGMLDQEMKALASSVESECFASVVVGNQSIVVADAGRPGKKALPVRVGDRFPIMAPVGHVFMAWASPQQVEDWVARAEGPGMTMDRARLARELAETRERGYMAALYEDVTRQPAEVIDVLTTLPQDSRQSERVRKAVAAFGKGWEMLSPAPGQLYDVSNVSAPIFNAQGKVIITIVINGFSQIEGGELLARIERLLQTTRMLTKLGGGRAPD